MQDCTGIKLFVNVLPFFNLYCPTAGQGYSPSRGEAQGYLYSYIFRTFGAFSCTRYETCIVVLRIELRRSTVLRFRYVAAKAFLAHIFWHKLCTSLRECHTWSTEMTFTKLIVFYDKSGGLATRAVWLTELTPAVIFQRSTIELSSQELQSFVFSLEHITGI